MNVHILSVPYDSGQRGVRMGAGPEHLLEAGLETRLRTAGHAVAVERIEPPASDIPAEIATAFELARTLSDSVRRAVEQGRLPVVLAGNCMTALGTLAGIRDAEPGIIWFDAHGDFNTPETTVGGFLDGMALTAATGRCWVQLASSIPGFQPINDRNVLMLGARDLDPLEVVALNSAEVAWLSPELLRQSLDAELDALRARVRTVYVHLDLDVLDPSVGKVNSYAAPDGLTLEELRATLGRIVQRFRVGAVALTAYDPAYDGDGRVARAAFDALETVVGEISEAGMADTG
ncbi:MAG: arginase family protein [Gemmatimonadales bacterium]|nr:arginase family protein [Gemmatimonadales bacterium]